MVTLYPVGKSSYGELAGIMQFVVDSVVAAQVNALIEESRAAFAGGAVLSVNEANRSRARQKYLRQKYDDYRRGGPWAALAADLYLSTHDETRGNALDFGVTMPDGTNRAMTMSEHAWVVARGKQRGIVWTGGDPSFMTPAELWHFNGYPTRATIPASIGAVIIPTPQEDEMSKPRLVRNATTKVVYYLFPDRVIQTKNADEIYALGRGWGVLKPGENWQLVVDEISAGECDRTVTEINESRTKSRGEYVADIARGVWEHLVDGWNGKQKAGNRLQGIDEKAGKR